MSTQESLEDSDEEFEDASGQISKDEILDLDSAMAEVNIAISLFFNNEFNEARKLMAEKSSTSMYHAIGVSTLRFMESVMTFENKDINEAMTCIKSAIQICNRHRRKQNLTTSFQKMLGLSETTELTDSELHAELIFAELNLYRSALTFIQDENLLSFIRGALKVRLCYQTYNYCYKIVAAEGFNLKQNCHHFHGGVMLGCGAFNIGLSLLPPRILSLLEWIGFSSDKQTGLDQLKTGYTSPNLRSSLISLFILGYNLFVSVHLGTHDADLVYTEKVLSEMLQKYPKGVYFHLFAGRLKQLQGNFTEAIDHLIQAAEIQTEWKQFSHICYWEIMWCHTFTMNWKSAAKYAEILRTESNWSKCVYSYLRAVFLYVDDKDGNAEEIRKLMREVPELKQRFAGKSIPMEKFITRKARKFLEQGEHLVMPVHEMAYAWNGLVMLKQNSELRNKLLQLIQQEQNSLEKRKALSPEKGSSSDVNKTKKSKDGKMNGNYFDDYCLLQLLKGACLRYGNQFLQAELCYTDIRENFKGIAKDHYLAPAGLSDLVWMWIEQGKTGEAAELLKFTKKTYTHYSMESRLHFRMQAAQLRLQECASKLQQSMH
uniref:Tetratricopeptide repeat protein 39B n=1 Tax=Phallusia mammillata TaxID=59560 RepID=A0A6F9DV90_9ASCI|nr:tetratricopeptide repeat protein 39B [Phallusia mammillata]